MKSLILIVTFITLASCSNINCKKDNSLIKPLTDTIVKHDTAFLGNGDNWQKGFGLTNNPDKDSIWGKPIRYYINNPKCSPIAKDFYSGQFRPTDNETTSALLSLATTRYNELRPFYRWCLNKTILIQDGALAEYTGVPARHYAEQFPKEFFEYMDFDTTGQKYSDWVSSISYSGYYDNEDYKRPEKIRENLIKLMSENCKHCDNKTLKRIEQFAKDCFE